MPPEEQADHVCSACGKTFENERELEAHLDAVGIVH